MAPKASDPHQKTLAAGIQLQEAMLMAAKALTTIAGILPDLFPDDTGSIIPQRTTSSSPVAIRNVSILKDDSADATPPSNKRKRKEKDPDAPEKPLSAYHLYAKEKREEVKNALGAESSGTDVLLAINRAWKELSEDLRKVWNVCFAC
jgi:hypothetical protein